MLSEPIFFNKDILDPSTGLPLVNHQNAKAGITRITDVSYSVVPRLLPDAAVHELLSGTVSLKRTSGFMGRLRSSLPDEWSRLLNSDETSELSAEHSSFRIDDPATKEKIPTTKMTTKKIYDILIQQADDVFSKRHKKWEYDFSYPIDWKPIWKAAYDNFSENKHCNLHWRFLHRALPLAPALFKNKKDSSPVCVLCSQNKNETLRHLFFECQGIQPIQDTQNLIVTILKMPFRLLLDHMVFNFACNKSSPIMKLCTYLINITRYSIWQGRNAIKFDKATFDFRSYLNSIIKERLQVEFFIAKHLKCNLLEFETLWACNNALCSIIDSSLVYIL